MYDVTSVGLTKQKSVYQQTYFCAMTCNKNTPSKLPEVRFMAHLFHQTKGTEQLNSAKCPNCTYVTTLIPRLVKQPVDVLVFIYNTDKGLIDLNPALIALCFHSVFIDIGRQCCDFRTFRLLSLLPMRQTCFQSSRLAYSNEDIILSINCVFRDVDTDLLIICVKYFLSNHVSS